MRLSNISKAAIHNGLENQRGFDCASLAKKDPLSA